MLLTVGRLAKLSGLSVRSLHHYDEIGLLVPSQRGESGYRLYGPTDIERLYRIQALRGLGLSLAEVHAALTQDEPVADLVERQIAALTTEIDRSTALRARLLRLQSSIAQGKAPEATHWLNTLALSNLYEKHLSLEEIDRLVPFKEDEIEAWQQLVVAVADAVERNVAPASDEAQSLGHRWAGFVMRQFGGDIELALKMKAAYAGSEALQESSIVAAGVTREMMQFIWDALDHGHLQLLGKYFSPAELARIRVTDSARAEWLAAVKALRDAMTRSDDDEVQKMIRQWRDLFDAVVDHDASLGERLLTALGSEAGLRKRWLIDADLLDFVRRTESHRTVLNT
jgi:DNA-binding transcriptional MerR regulator